MHPRYADFIFNSFRSPENGLSRYFEMRNLKSNVNVPFFPGCRFFPFRLYSLVFKCHECADPEGGGGRGSGPPSLVNHKFGQII